MITINSQKMSKSLGNFITLDELFSGEHKILTQPYSPMVVRFFILQAHYRSTVDFSNEALQAAEKGLEKLMNSLETLEKITPGDKSDFDILAFREKCYNALNDDLNSPVLIAHLFDAVRFINSVSDGKSSITESDLNELKSLFHSFTFDILGLRQIQSSQQAGQHEILNDAIHTLLDIRQQAKKDKDFQTADMIRNRLNEMNIKVTDTPNGPEWSLEQ